MAIAALQTVDLRPPNTIGKTSTFDHKAFGRYQDECKTTAGREVSGDINNQCNLPSSRWAT